jgi:hypothetical protein
MSQGKEREKEGGGERSSSDNQINKLGKDKNKNKKK